MSPLDVCAQAAAVDGERAGRGSAHARTFLAQCLSVSEAAGGEPELPALTEARSEC